jgi:hypothetical protein
MDTLKLQQRHGFEGTSEQERVQESAQFARKTMKKVSLKTSLTLAKERQFLRHQVKKYTGM